MNSKFGHWEYEFENLGTKILSWKFGIWDILKTLKKKVFFFFFCWLSLRLSLSVGAEFWPPTFLCLSLFPFFSSFSTSLPPLSLFTLFFPLDFLLHLTISSHEKYFSKLLKLPSSISINISSDPCVLKHFIMYPFLVKPIFQNSFSLHQNGFFLQEIFLSNFSW